MTPHVTNRQLFHQSFPLRLSARPWADRAACRGLDTDLFFPKEYTSLKAKEAKAICAECPVVIECRRYALATMTDWGIFGGMSPKERVYWGMSNA